MVSGIVSPLYCTFGTTRRHGVFGFSFVHTWPAKTPIRHSFPSDICKFWILSLLGQHSNCAIVISEYFSLLTLLLIGCFRTTSFLSLFSLELHCELMSRT